MNLDDNMARAISTVAIWAATAVIFVFGVFRLSATGDGIFLWFIIALALAICPAVGAAALRFMVRGKMFRILNGQNRY